MMQIYSNPIGMIHIVALDFNPVPPGVSDARTEKAHLQTHAETNPTYAPQIKGMTALKHNL